MDKEQVKDIAKDCGLVVGQHWNRSNMTTAFMLDFANAAIESYKAELLKEVGEPVLYAEFAEDGGWLGDASEYADHLEEPHALFSSDQVAAAINKATKPLDDQLAKAEQLWQVAQGRCDGLEEKLTKAEQRVAEACAELAYSRDYEVEGRGYYDQGGDARQTCYDIYDAIKKGEWRKFVKEV